MVNPSVSKVIQALIVADAGIMALLTGGVHTRPIVRDQKNDPLDPMVGSTPEAFETDPPYRIKPNMSIEEGSAHRNSGGPRGAMWQFPTLWLRSQPKDTEKAKLEDVFVRLLAIFGTANGKLVLMPSGSGGSIKVVERLGPIDDRTISGAIVMMVRCQLDGVWRLEP